MGLGKFRPEASVPCVSLPSDSAPLRDVQSLSCPEVPFGDMNQRQVRNERRLGGDLPEHACSGMPAGIRIPHSSS